MRKLIFLPIILLGLQVNAQQQLTFNLRFNTDLNRYEVYVKPNFTASNFTWGPSQISIVVPSSLVDQPLAVTSHAAGTWGDNSLVFAPMVKPESDFHGVSSSGQLTNLVANEERLVFSFPPLGGQCTPGLRLFNNGIDPNSNASGMLGGDFNNTIDNGNLTDVYSGNYNNDGTQCAVLPTDSFYNSTIVIFPNPVKSEVNISGLITDENVIELNDVNGKLIKTFKTNQSALTIDMSKYASGLYFVKITNKDSQTKLEKLLKVE